MNVIDVYNIAEKENIDTINYKWTNAKARIFEIKNRYYIGIDYTNICNMHEEKQILAEELGHYYCNALYYINSDAVLKNKCEYRAKKWACNVLVPIQILKEKISNNINDIYELAEIFEVTPVFMQQTIQFYEERGLL